MRTHRSRSWWWAPACSPVMSSCRRSTTCSGAAKWAPSRSRPPAPPGWRRWPLTRNLPRRFPAGSSRRTPTSETAAATRARTCAPWMRWPRSSLSSWPYPITCITRSSSTRCSATSMSTASSRWCSASSMAARSVRLPPSAGCSSGSTTTSASTAARWSPAASTAAATSGSSPTARPGCSSPTSTATRTSRTGSPATTATRSPTWAATTWTWCTSSPACVRWRSASPAPPAPFPTATPATCGRTDGCTGRTARSCR